MEKGDCGIVVVPVMDPSEHACINSLSTNITRNDDIFLKCNIRLIKHASHRKGHVLHLVRRATCHNISNKEIT